MTPRVLPPLHNISPTHFHEKKMKTSNRVISAKFCGKAPFLQVKEKKMRANFQSLIQSGTVFFFSFLKIYSFLNQRFSFFEYKVLQLMSAEASLERFGERPCFHKMKIAQNTVLKKNGLWIFNLGERA